MIECRRTKSQRLQATDDQDLISSCLELAKDESAEAAIVSRTTGYGTDLLTIGQCRAQIMALVRVVYGVSKLLC